MEGYQFKEMAASSGWRAAHLAELSDVLEELQNLIEYQQLADDRFEVARELISRASKELNAAEASR